MTRTATLDGGAVIDHRGFSDGDRAFEIEANLTAAEADALWYMHRNETLLHISCPEGFFTGAISEIKADGGRLKMTFLAKESDKMQSLKIGTTWVWEHWLAGRLFNTWREKNLFTLEGRNEILDVFFAWLKSDNYSLSG